MEKPGVKFLPHSSRPGDQHLSIHHRNARQLSECGVVPPALPVEPEVRGDRDRALRPGERRTRHGGNLLTGIVRGNPPPCELEPSLLRPLLPPALRVVNSATRDKRCSPLE